jgi:prepilin-type N-terminal cleavage/methylation domain-containing protein
MKEHKGVSLIELLIAVALVSVVVAATSLLFPKASQSLVDNRQRLEATTLATGKIDEIKKQPYDYIHVTSTGTYFNANCNCSAITNFSAFPSSSTDVSEFSGIPYTRYACINYVTFAAGGVWTAQCPGNGDTQAKYIRVHVTWKYGANQYVSDQESIASAN